MIKFNNETQRISLGMKQLEEDPWTSIEEKYPIGSKTTGRITILLIMALLLNLMMVLKDLFMVLKLAGPKKHSLWKNCFNKWTSWGYGF